MRARLLGNGRFELWGGNAELDFTPLLSRCHVEPDDAVIVSGTLIEGIGNRLSDIDTYVICKERRSLSDIDWRQHDFINFSVLKYYDPFLSPLKLTADGKLHEFDDYVDVGSLALGVQFWTFDDIEKIAALIREEFSLAIRHATGVPDGTYRNKTFIHRLINGIALQGDNLVAPLVNKIDKYEFCFLCYRSLIANSHNRLRDIIGNWQNLEFFTAAHLAQEHINQLMFAFTYLTGNTNPVLKWLYKKIEQLPADFKSIGDVFVDVSAMPKKTILEKKEFILAALDVTDDIQKASQSLLDKNPKLPSSKELAVLTEKEFESRYGDRKTLAPGLLQHYEFRSKNFRNDLPRSRDLLLHHAESCVW